MSINFAVICDDDTPGGSKEDTVTLEEIVETTNSKTLECLEYTISRASDCRLKIMIQKLVPTAQNDDVGHRAGTMEKHLIHIFFFQPSQSLPSSSNMKVKHKSPHKWVQAPGTDIENRSRTEHKNRMAHEKFAVELIKTNDSSSDLIAWDLKLSDSSKITLEHRNSHTVDADFIYYETKGVLNISQYKGMSWDETTLHYIVIAAILGGTSVDKVVSTLMEAGPTDNEI